MKDRNTNENLVKKGNGRETSLSIENIATKYSINEDYVEMLFASWDTNDWEGVKHILMVFEDTISFEIYPQFLKDILKYIHQCQFPPQTEPKENTDKIESLKNIISLHQHHYKWYVIDECGTTECNPELSDKFFKMYLSKKFKTESILQEQLELSENWAINLSENILGIYGWDKSTFSDVSRLWNLLEEIGWNINCNVDFNEGTVKFVVKLKNMEMGI